MPKFVDAAIRRQEVVEAVFRIVAADGLERASLREVADEAELAVGSVRHYFASSDELLAHSFGVVVDRVVGRLESADERLAGTRPGTPEHHRGVLTLLGEFLPLDEERAVDACVWMAFKNAARTKPFLAAEADRSHRAVAAIVGRLVMDLSSAAGTDASQDEQRLVTEAERLLATLDGLTMHALLQPEWMTAQVCSDVLEAHLTGLGSHPGSH
ncbi:TetR family transcriptional regulator C-terminal domain-containing protein [Arthrobacter sp. AL08]|uniref:TetR/AcrR family transcriptional regulator n=1 Tax=Micrococcaceae TaxID=1268 RepID=UPI001CFF7739|nr:MULTISPECIES: TetR family transcriptional regulator C-terminal domain-containing protein [Micrococcaceae]MCB5283531.1 HTH-type transcriptional regulator BetI [Arthrobacter sp. ES1]MDI3241293.1 TetR family transcriptional regulator C-terminal domain-containing protein [Arthrobacter sp. AL05]MDI3277450.1 TetR family transcriptional regulator C-terminal domain-containing protein [Arthrobacter sp. AL08]MDJ0354112.1 TetR family transcriptional regulator C-terminal domain-containing protein [Pseud